MTSERSQAYGRVSRTLAEIGPAKLLPAEQDRIRDAADTLLFSETGDAPGAEHAVRDIDNLTRHLVASGRWTDERAQDLRDDVSACGPLTSVF
jgi:hypothetical protein